MTRAERNVPYFLDHDDVIKRYECLRDVWESKSSISSACQRFGISRTFYYEIEDRFITCGLSGIFPELNGVPQSPELEKLVMLVKTARPSISQQNIYRITQALPQSQGETSPEAISQILKSHGHGFSDQGNDVSFFARIQRTLNPTLTDG